MIHRKMAAALPAMVLTLSTLVIAADPDINILKNNGSLDRLFKKSGVYNASGTGKRPAARKVRSFTNLKPKTAFESEETRIVPNLVRLID